ncbi:putative non-specific serine/threonine protein kinase [Rosa chinensis]|uniref:Putative non-specific serine/threonine protein kinase n=1 Tax=Rosa chinensis TaxID=74649 RepID=A0A2P6S2W6_ROSCH|nr:putative non-specific serine/threonine protein kinase [Rosa chinensis]
MTAAQALTHPWLRDERQAVLLDLVIHKMVKSYVRATPFRCAAMKALSKAMTEDDLYYLRAQFTLLEPKHGYVSLDNFRTIKTRKLNIAAPLDPAAFADAVVPDFIWIMLVIWNLLPRALNLQTLTSQDTVTSFFRLLSLGAVHNHAWT